MEIETRGREILGERRAMEEREEESQGLVVASYDWQHGNPRKEEGEELRKRDMEINLIPNLL